MHRTYKFAIALFVLVVIVLTWLETSVKEEINWNPSYTHYDEIPLGSKVFYESWKRTSGDRLEMLKIPPYEFLNSEEAKGSYFFFNTGVVFDDDELDHLLNWVAEGNTVFISAHDYSQNLKDTLKIETGSEIDVDGFTEAQDLNFYNPRIKLKDDALFDKQVTKSFFIEIDTLNHQALGFTRKDKLLPKVNFIRADFGEGAIFLHTAPQVFSNYFMLKEDNYKYTGNLLAYIPAGKVYWDAYYKSGKSFYTSSLYILLNNRSLKWAYYAVLFCIVLYIVFEGKRKQRAIPVIDPPNNRSYEYTAIISSLYLEQNRFQELGDKKIALFLEFIRREYRLETSKIDAEFKKDLAAKSSKSLEATNDLFKKIESFQKNKNSTKQEFLELSTYINHYKFTDGKSGTT
tara:strand:+ start:335 stop:1540 length:1206 start_codon:yes stop_codon:yes gene_type:complete